VPSTWTVLSSCIAPTSCWAALAGSASLSGMFCGASFWACVALRTERSWESQIHTVSPSATIVVSDMCWLSEIRALPVPSVYTRAAMPSAPPEGRIGIGSPRFSLISTEPAIAGTLVVSTDCTSASALIGGNGGGAPPAPAGVATMTRPTSPAAVPAAATPSAVVFVFIRIPLVLPPCSRTTQGAPW
jgi:hypothetical protein